MPLSIAHQGTECPAGLRPGAVFTIGNFDGMHPGHQAVISAACALASERGAQSVIITFLPHPVEVLRPQSAPGLLLPPERRLKMLLAQGADVLWVLPFSKAMASLTAAEFIRRFLAPLSPAVLVLGRDSKIGSDRRMGTAQLGPILGEIGADVFSVPPVVRGGETISSSRIRTALSLGNVEEAESLLGRPYRLWGRVEQGRAVGRTIGFPTANLDCERQLVPADGVYVVRAQVGDGGAVLAGVAAVGLRPTFAGAGFGVEVHLFELHADLYGCCLAVDFVRLLRGIEKFDSQHELSAAIAADVARARELLG